MVESQIIISYAGLAAEERFTGRKSVDDCEGDFRTIADLASRIHRGEVLEKYLDYTLARTRVLVGSALWWASIEAVAEALMEHKRLTGPQIRTVANEAVFGTRRMGLLAEVNAREMAEQERLQAEFAPSESAG